MPQHFQRFSDIRFRNRFIRMMAHAACTTNKQHADRKPAGQNGGVMSGAARKSKCLQPCFNDAVHEHLLYAGVASHGAERLRVSHIELDATLLSNERRPMGYCAKCGIANIIVLVPHIERQTDFAGNYVRNIRTDVQLTNCGDKTCLITRNLLDRHDKLRGRRHCILRAFIGTAPACPALPTNSNVARV